MPRSNSISNGTLARNPWYLLRLSSLPLLAMADFHPLSASYVGCDLETAQSCISMMTYPVDCAIKRSYRIYPVRIVRAYPQHAQRNVYGSQYTMHTSFVFSLPFSSCVHSVQNQSSYPSISNGLMFPETLIQSCLRFRETHRRPRRRTQSDARHQRGSEGPSLLASRRLPPPPPRVVRRP